MHEAIDRNPFILFVNPSLGTTRYKKEDILRTYLSLGTLASALTNRGFLKRFCRCLGKEAFIFDDESAYPDFDLRVIHLSLKPDRQTVHDYLSAFLRQVGISPLMVCMTATSAQLDEAEAVACAAEQIAPGALRIIGGPHVSVVADEYLECSEFQVACIGEGVETLSELALLISSCNHHDFSSVLGIAFKESTGRVQTNPRRIPLFDLDAYPFPSDSLALFWGQASLKEKHQNHIYYILAGYGCPHNCIFCSQRAIHDTRIRERSAENIFQEITGLSKKGFRKFAFVQETFFNRKKRIETFCKMIEASVMDIEWTAEARVDQLKYRELKRMRSAGLRFVQIGVETGDSELLEHLGKNVDLDRVIEVRRWCIDLQINTVFYLLVGLPGQGWQSIFRSALFFMKHPPYNRFTRHASVSIAIPYPGTQIWEDQSVRLIAREKNQLSWPDRNPEVSVNDFGEFIGQNYTETDDLTSDEITEAWIYLDDFCHFLLHALYPDQKDLSGCGQSMEYANRMFYMIKRRTIRDLIIRAQSELTHEKRKSAYEEIITIDGDAERHFKDVTSSTEPDSEVFNRFLANAQFSNGFDTMKCLSIDNRIKWMKICTVVWHFNGRVINNFRFDNDHKEVGIEIDRQLQTLDELRLNRYLSQIDSGVSTELFPDIIYSNQHIFVFGFTFFSYKNRTIEIVLQ